MAGKPTRHDAEIDPLIGARMVERREQLGLAIEAVANRVGMKVGRLAEIERGTRSASPSQLLQLSEALETTVGWLFVDTYSREHADAANAQHARTDAAILLALSEDKTGQLRERVLRAIRSDDAD